MPNVIVVGPSIPQVLFTKEYSSYSIIHAPLIKLKALPLPRSIITLLKRKEYSTLILTSKHAAYESRRLFIHHSVPLPQKLVCVGEKTLEHAKENLKPLFSQKIDCYIAKTENQEGVVECIQKNINPKEGSLLWPSSSKARATLKKNLISFEYQCDQIPLYQPIAIYRKIVWQEDDMIFFTCPSSVEAFFKYYPDPYPILPRFNTIGSITESFLSKHLSRISFLNLSPKC